MSNMHIEDFKAKVAQFQVGDELRLEELCAEWNEEVPPPGVDYEAENDDLKGQIAELEDTIKSQHSEIEKLEDLDDRNAEDIKEMELTLASTEEKLKICREEIEELKRELKRARSTIRTLIDEGVQ